MTKAKAKKTVKAASALVKVELTRDTVARVKAWGREHGQTFEDAANRLTATGVSRKTTLIRFAKNQKKKAAKAKLPAKKRGRPAKVKKAA